MGKFVESPMEFQKPKRSGPSGAQYNGEDVPGGYSRTKSSNAEDEVTRDATKTNVKPGDLSSVKYDRKSSDD